MAKKQALPKTVGLYVGANPESVSEAREAINDILASGADQATMQAALEVLPRLFSPNTVSNCSFHVGGEA